MKKLIAIALSTVMLIALVPAVALAGNGLPDEATGQHYNLNIIGVKNAKNVNMDTDYDSASGHVIFVALDGHSKIGLVEGDDYAVLDKNGTDADGALLQLPDPGLDPYIVGEAGDADTISDYSVFVRPLGTPGGWATITTCAELVDSEFGGLLPGKTMDDIMNSPGYFGGFASVEQVGQDITFRDTGKSTFTNVTAQLLTIVFKVAYDLDADGVIEEGEYKYVRVPIFDDIIQGEYWDYDNHGLKLLQVRFYPCGTDVSEADLLLP